MDGKKPKVSFIFLASAVAIIAADSAIRFNPNNHRCVVRAVMQEPA